jgi:hypothetical protein
MAKKNLVVMPYHDHQRRTCIQVERVNGHVKYIPLDVSTGLEVQKTSAESFDQRFTPMEGYPAEKACQLYLSYSQNIGATKEALDYLGQIINVSKQELEMATTKKAAAAEKTAAKPVTKKAAPAKTAAKTKSTEVVKAGRRAIDPVVKTPAKKTGEKKQSAAQMFQDLIMEGKLTDDKIFEKVQEKFGLDEKKRGYVKWYRNHLKKQGMNPPEAKVK